jgi:hypothetical protein
MRLGERPLPKPENIICVALLILAAGAEEEDVEHADMVNTAGSFS